MSVNPFTQSLKVIVDVEVYVSPAAAARQTFNQGLIVGTTNNIQTSGANSRIRVYMSADALLADGFVSTDPEYLAAVMYFSQSPAPSYLWVGRQDLTAIETATVDADNKGTNYVAGDILTVVHAGASGGTFQVTSVDGGGAVTGISKVIGGTGYVVADEQVTTTNSLVGAGCHLHVTAIGETPLEALQACRAANWDWYGAVALAALKADNEAIAAWVESAQPSSFYEYVTSEADLVNGVAGNIGAVLKAANYNRTSGIYKSDSAYAAAAVLGRTMGLNTGLANSAFTMKFKTLTGLVSEDLTTNQVRTIEGYNVNLYLSYANYYNWLEQGVMASGLFFDQLINRDMLANSIQLAVADLLNQNLKIPQTDDGMTMIAHKIGQACEDAVNIGYLAPGTWTGAPVLDLNTGDALPKGYLVLAPAVASQSDADRQLRKSVPFYIAVKEAGAVHSCLIGVYVDI